MCGKVFYINAPVVQFAVYGNLFAFVDNIAVDIANAGKANQYACAVGIAQPSFYVKFIV
jgi:hypothetical protein